MAVRALVANAPTPAAGARRLGGDLVAGAREHVPAGAEGAHALAVGVAGALVAREGVERVAVVGHLGLPSERGLVLTSEALAPLPTVGLPLARRGGQALAQAPVHALLVPESFLNR